MKWFWRLLPSLTIVLLPTYAWRFSWAGLPLNFLLVFCAVVIVIFALHVFCSPYWRKLLRQSIKTLPPLSFAGMWLLLIGGLLSLYVADISQKALGLFVVLVVIPLLMFFVIKTVVVIYPESKKYFWISALAFVSFCGAVAIVQYFTLSWLPESYWGNALEPKRSLSIFAHPNFYGLFVAPLLAFLWPIVSGVKKQAKFLAIFLWGIAAAGVFLSLSRGAWLGLFLAGVVWFIFALKPKAKLYALLFALLAIIIISAVPNWRYRLLLPFRGEQSTSFRATLIQTAQGQISSSPVLGWGWGGFGNHYTFENNQVVLHKHPHNLWLTAWGELTVFGFIGLALVFLSFGRHSWMGRKHSPWTFGVALSLVVVLGHGLVDTPYFKNDLAMLFWTLLALL